MMIWPVWCDVDLGPLWCEGVRLFSWFHSQCLWVCVLCECEQRELRLKRCVLVGEWWDHAPVMNGPDAIWDRGRVTLSSFLMIGLIKIIFLNFLKLFYLVICYYFEVLIIQKNYFYKNLNIFQNMKYFLFSEVNLA